ncbi:glutathione S-transferase family protein [Chroococcidiopsis sp. CCNUC1]|jgi:glutathione S-transferase|uniref:glutathione S-transferase family protein n=1 Tax=Chroococcidiopsis sp. CCNUC1 TaxID=2653189 RepID=UPI000D07AA68|nr:glutathione S-transferase family protein [Chroococcidiopsis sp. CCNUC1]PSB47615.1 glutathione S-transferase [Cyanosarcina cf. burmensis CCALA 770]URD48888.1 glutathione S-transferase family protein [Chroococcidiopsis sp. CCNUC1]
MIQLYDFVLSGNCHKVRLLLSILNLDYESVPVNLKAGEHKTERFLQLNPCGQVPVFVDGDVILRDSQAILVYLARRYGGEDWLPLEPEAIAKIMQWLSFAANEIANSLAAARRYFIFKGQLDIDLTQQKAYQVLQILDRHLTNNQWLESSHPTIADLACFPYVGLAADAKVALDNYPHVIAWCDRIKRLPGYVSMPGL